MNQIQRVITSILLAIAMVSLHTGCADTAAVRNIVDETNRLVVELAVSPDGDVVTANNVGDGTTPTWIEQVDAIERYIAEHPDQTRTNNALRIRQATVLMRVDQPNLARIAFEQVDQAQLFSERDRALFELQNEFIWWYSTAGATFSSADRDLGNDAMIEIARVADELPRTSATRRTLERMHVRIGTSVANTLGTRDGIREKLSDATTRYGEQFSETDRVLIQAWHADSIDDPNADLLQNLRWFDYVPTAYRNAEGVWRRSVGDSDAPRQFTPDWVACIEESALACE